MNPWIGIIGVVVGALLGGGLTMLNAHLQTRRQVQHERRKLILSKLEELHEAITHLKVAHTKILPDLLSQKDNADVKESAIETRDLGAEKIEMLVGFYAPELSKYILPMIKANVTHMRTTVLHVIAKREGQDPKENNFEAVVSTLKDLDRILSKMQDELEGISKRYI